MAEVTFGWGFSHGAASQWMMWGQTAHGVVSRRRTSAHRHLAHERAGSGMGYSPQSRMTCAQLASSRAPDGWAVQRPCLGLDAPSRSLSLDLPMEPPPRARHSAAGAPSSIRAIGSTGTPACRLLCRSGALPDRAGRRGQHSGGRFAIRCNLLRDGCNSHAADAKAPPCRWAQRSISLVVKALMRCCRLPPEGFSTAVLDAPSRLRTARPPRGAEASWFATMLITWRNRDPSGYHHRASASAYRRAPHPPAHRIRPSRRFPGRAAGPRRRR